MQQFVLIALLLGWANPPAIVTDAGVVIAQAPAPAKAGVIVFPEITVPLPVTPQPPDSDGTPLLTSDQTYVVQSDAEFFLIPSVDGILDIKMNEGPMTIRSRFPDDPTNKLTTRKFTSKWIATVEVIEGMQGRVTLMGIPKGVTDQNAIQRRMIDAGQAPQPPPPDVDPKPPGPKPEPPKPTPTADGFRVIMVYETGNQLTAAQDAVLRSKDIQAYLDRKCSKDAKIGSPDWRRWDYDVEVRSSEGKAISDLWSQVKSKVDISTGPKIVVANKGNADIWPFPDGKDSKAAVAEVLKDLKEVAGE